MTEIVYKDIAPGAMEGATPAMTDIQPFCKPSELTHEITPHKIATLEDDYFRLDGTFELFPDDPATIEWGAWSKSMSGVDGAFALPIVLTLQLDNLYSSVGVSFTFDPYEPNWCNDLNVKWYRDSALLADKDFAPNAASYSCINEVHTYNKVVVTFRAMSKPYRYLKLKTPIYGISRTFDGDELRDGVSLFQACSPISEDLEINTMQFRLSSKDPVPFLFQRKQPMHTYHNGNLQGVFYISKSKRVAESIYDIESTDLVGLLDESNHLGGIYTNVGFSALAAEILGAYPFEIDSTLATVKLSGWLPIASRRNNLAQAAFAAGALVDTSGSDVVRIFPAAQRVTAEFDGDRVYSGSDVETASLVTGVEITEHKYTQSSNANELFNDVLSGTVDVTFSEPMHGLTITGGTIKTQGTNGATITGTGGTVVLTGKAYNHTTKVVTLSNPNVGAGDIANVVQVTDATLVSAGNAAAIAQRVYDYYQRREIVNADVVLSDEKPGDAVTISTEFDGTKTGVIKSLDVDLARKRIGKAVIVCE